MVDSNGNEVLPAVELALALSQAMMRRDEGSLPMVRRNQELPTALVKVSLPILLRRAFASDRFLFSDLSQTLIDRLNLPAHPSFTLRESNWQLRENDSFGSDALLLAEQCASVSSFQYESSLVGLLINLGEIIKTENLITDNQGWGTPIPIGDDSFTKIRQEQDNLIAWFVLYNSEQEIVEKLQKTLREVGTRRLEYFEMQKAKALQLLNQEISTISPQVDQQLGDLKQQQGMLLQQKNSLQVRFAEYEEQIGILGTQMQRYKGTAPQMAEYYADRIRKTREEMRYLSEQQSKNEEDILEEVSARSLLLRRPLAILEQQKMQAERQWQQAINAERDLISTLANILQDTSISLQQAATLLLNRSQVSKSDLPDSLIVEIPLVFVRMQGQSSSSCRYLVLPPSLIKQAGQISRVFTDLVRGVRLPLVSRGSTWDELAKIIEERINKQELPVWLYTLFAEKNLLQQESSGALYEAGISQLKDGGLLNDRIADQLVAQVRDVLPLIPLSPIPKTVSEPEDDTLPPSENSSQDKQEGL